ncbi:hypothetical protein BDN71DRAFT_1594670, partial [Pleurotus eryngii]
MAVCASEAPHSFSPLRILPPMARTSNVPTVDALLAMMAFMNISAADIQGFADVFNEASNRVSAGSTSADDDFVALSAADGDGGGAVSSVSSVAPVTAATQAPVTAATQAPVTAATQAPVAALAAAPAQAPVAAPTEDGPPPGSTAPWVVPVGYDYHLPDADEDGPYYAIVRGHAVGVFAGWEATSPLVTGVSGAIFR